MTQKILILAPQTDDHAPWVAQELINRGHKVDALCGSDFPRLDTVSLRIAQSKTNVRIRKSGHADSALCLEEYSTVWRRRGETPQTDEAALHPDDRPFAANEAEAAANGWRDLSALSKTRWVNPRQAAERADYNKPYQLHVAARCGLSTPDTLISNDPTAIAEFHAAHEKCIIYKPLTPALFREQDGDKVSFVDIFPDNAFDDPDVLRLAPGIYQPYIEKAYELRITVMGQRCIAARIRNQHVEGAEIDWRSKVGHTDIDLVQLPASVERALLKFMHRMGLVFGAVDMVVTPEGEHVFLEVNQMGQFLWVDRIVGSQVLLHAMCDFLTDTTAKPLPDISRNRFALAPVA